MTTKPFGEQLPVPEVTEVDIELEPSPAFLEAQYERLFLAAMVLDLENPPELRWPTIKPEAEIPVGHADTDKEQGQKEVPPWVRPAGKQLYEEIDVADLRFMTWDERTKEWK